MKKWVENITLFLWVFLFNYLFDVFFGMARNIYYLLIGGTLIIGGVLFILHLFEKNIK